MAPPHLRPILGGRLPVRIPPLLRRLHRPTLQIRPLHPSQHTCSTPHLPPLYSCYGSSNGLLLLLLHDSQISHHDDISVLNPITGASVQIPEFQIPAGTSSGVYGFICNLGHNGVASYKVFVLTMMAPTPSNRLRIATFFSDAREWGTSYIDLPRHVHFSHEGSRAMVASDGIIYLIDDVLVPNEDEWDGHRTVVSCDPIEGSAEMITSPSWDVDDHYFSFSMGQDYDGSLSVFRRRDRTPHFDVWVLSHDKTWTLKHRFSFGSENHRCIKILYFCKEDRAIYLNLQSRIVRGYYEDEQWRFEDVCAYELPCELGIHVKPFIFSPWPASVPTITL